MGVTEALSDAVARASRLSNADESCVPPFLKRKQ
jgi:hypothetical protein